MTKRRLTEQQQRRINSQLDQRKNRLENISVDTTETAHAELHGLIITHHGKTLIVEDDEGSLYRCSARQNIGHPVCGDRVVWQASSSSEGVIIAIQERNSLLVRPGFADKIKPVAANITLICIVIAPEPEPQEILIDSYLIAAEHLGIRPVLVCNKSDLLNKDTLKAWQDRFSIYNNLGYELIETSTKQIQGLERLRPRLKGNTSILLGQSGVGKSSLINCLAPDQDIKISDLSSQIQKGRHTTSYSRLYHLPANGGDLIDSPGVRDFRLGHMDIKDIERGFIEFRPFLGKCRFTDCTHQTEPDCALRTAVECGDISPQRFRRYLDVSHKK